MATEAFTPPDPCPTGDALLGRERELVDLRRALGTRRLVALTGTVGVGKSRLAVTAAEGWHGEGGGRVRRADLGALLAPELFAGTLGYALRVPERPGVSELGGLARTLGTEPTLLLLDGAERLRGRGAAALEYLLDTCPELTVLSVGRAAPGSPYEYVQRLDPLAEPPATALLCLRARQFGAAPMVRGGREHLDALPLCHLLDRNPLAVELAASRLVATPPRQLMAETARPAGLLALAPGALDPAHAAAGRRHLPDRTLRSAAEASHELCTEDERLLWARLSGVPVGFDLTDAHQACAGTAPSATSLSGAALEAAWAGLIRGSVLVPYGAGATRYRLPFLLRAYGREQERRLRR
jgi:predicted ATPase